VGLLTLIGGVAKNMCKRFWYDFDVFCFEPKFKKFHKFTCASEKFENFKKSFLFDHRLELAGMATNRIAKSTKNVPKTALLGFNV
jgi:hypothetical protein